MFLKYKEKEKYKRGGERERAMIGFFIHTDSRE